MDFNKLVKKEKSLIRKHFANTKKVLNLRKIAHFHKSRMPENIENIEYLENAQPKNKQTFLKKFIAKEKIFLRAISGDFKKLGIIHFIEKEEKLILNELKKIIRISGKKPGKSAKSPKSPPALKKNHKTFREFISKEEKNIAHILFTLVKLGKLKKLVNEEKKAIGEKEIRLSKYLKLAPSRIKSLLHKEKLYLKRKEKRLEQFLMHLSHLRLFHKNAKKHLKKANKGRKKANALEHFFNAFNKTINQYAGALIRLFKLKSSKAQHQKQKKEVKEVKPCKRKVKLEKEHKKLKSEFKFPPIHRYFINGLNITLDQIAKIFEFKHHKKILETMESKNKIKKDAIRQIEQIQKLRNLSVDELEEIIEIYHNSLETILNIKYEFTYNELEKELQKTRLSPRVKNAILEISQRLEERFQESISKDEIHLLIDRIKALIAQL